MDKLETKLEIARKKANNIPKEDWYKITSFEFLGSEDRNGRTIYFYYDEAEDRFYSESDFDREMRAKIRKNKFQKKTKK